MTRKQHSVSAEDFVRAWQQSESVQQVMQITGMSESAVYVRSTKYRKLGIALKKYKAGSGSKLDVQALRKLADELAP